MRPRSLNPPNVITAARIALCPVIFVLALTPSLLARILAFVIFLAASMSDLWDGYLARKHGWITDTGKLLDPIADKLLLVSTFVPFYILSHGDRPVGALPWGGELPLWVLLVVFGRELLVTVFRSYAARRGVVIAAGKSGKYKAFFQNLFSGSLLLWYVLRMAALGSGWREELWDGWAAFHGAFVGGTLGLAVILTVYSMVDYLWSYRGVVMRGT
ncbi:MAG: CDP-alcohol phosphatidyltransferase family protein [Gemmatimonadetes bacterium]|nr:CDP-alcohol phosphatidyltransferase family protein [Gemmatimonadota bacterium]